MYIDFDSTDQDFIILTVSSNTLVVPHISRVKLGLRVTEILVERLISGMKENNGLASCPCVVFRGATVLAHFQAVSMKRCKCAAGRSQRGCPALPTPHQRLPGSVDPEKYLQMRTLKYQHEL